MADVNSNINVNIDTSGAIASIRALQAEISAFHTTMAKGGATANQQAAALQQTLINSVNKSGAFSASMTTVASTTEAFTTALEKNKLTMAQTFRYSMGASKTFGKLFRSEFDTVAKVARERVKDLQTQYLRMGRDANGAMQAIKVRPLLLDLDNMATKTALAAQKQQILNKLIDQGSTNLLNWGKNTQWAGRQLMVGFTIPLGMLGSVAAKSFMEIEQSVIKIQRVYGDFTTSVTETKEMTDALKNLANEFTKYGVSVVETLDLAAEAAAAGKTGADLLAQVSQASRLAVLGNVEQAQALEATMSVTNAFGIAAEDLAGKIDFLNAVENQSVTSIEDLTIAIPKAGPVIQQLGGSVEDLAFFLTAMKEGGINASEGANALKSGLASIINPTEKASEFLQGFGVNIKGIVDANKGDIKGIVVGFAEALNELDPLNRAQAIEQLFGKFQFARLSTLFQNVTKQGSQAQRVLGLAGASTEELAVLSERELKKIESSTTFQFQKAFEQFQSKLAPIGEQFLKAVTPIIEFGNRLLDQFNNMSDGAKSFAVIATAAVAGLGPIILMVIGLIGNASANLIKFFQFIRGRFTGTSQEVGVLGNQIEYMTQQQIEAQAAAASLAQSHSNLTQQFTSEASALARLTAAYQSAAAAQRSFGGAAAAAGVAAGKKVGVKKYAKGVVAVPGPKGKGDVVPAMLTPGEAVIPAGMAKKYAPLISAMVADSIPGFNGGLTSEDGNRNLDPYVGLSASEKEALYRRNYRLASAPPVVTRQTSTMQWDTLVQEQEAYVEASIKAARDAGVEVTDAMTLQFRKEAGLAASHITSDTTTQKIAGKDLDVKNWRAKNLVPDLQGTNNFLNTLKQKTLADGTNVIFDEFEQLRLGDTAKKLGISMDDARVELQNLRNGIHPVTKRSRAMLAELAESIPTLPSIQADLEGENKAKKKKAQSVAIQAAGPAAALRARSDQAQADIESGVIGYDPKQDKKSKAEMKAIVDKAKKDMDIVLAAENKDAVPAKSNTKKPRKTPAVAATRKINPRDVVAKVDKNGRVYYTANGRQIGNAEGEAAIDKVNKMDARNAKARETRATRAANLPVAVSGVDDAEERTARRQQRRAAMSRVSGRIGGGAMMLGMAGMMGGSMMGGPAGEALMALSGPATAVGMALSMIPGPAGLVVAGLAAVVLGAMSLKAQFDQARDAAMQLAEATGSGTTAINGLAEFAGTATAGQIMDKRREGALTRFGVQEGQSTFGQTYLESEGGMALAENTQKNILASGNTSAMSDLVNQMATAVATKALTADQAASIIEAVGAEINDYSFSINANAKLWSLIGPNGENLLTDPIGVRVNLINESNQRLQDSVGSSARKSFSASPVMAAGTLTGAYSTVKMAQNLAASSNLIQTTGSRLGALAARIGVSIGTRTAVGAAAGLPGGPAAVVTGIVGAAIGVVDAVGQVNSYMSTLGKYSGAMTANGIIALQQNQEMLDSLQLEYDQRIAIAKAAGDTVEAERLIGEYQSGRQQLLAAGAKTYETLSGAYAQTNVFDNSRQSLNDSIDKAISIAYEGDALMQMAAEGTREQIINSAGTDEEEYTLKLALASKDVDPQTLGNILGLMGDTQEGVTKVVSLITQFGGAGADRVFQIANMFSDPEKQEEFIISMAGKSDEEANRILETYELLQKTGEILDLDVVMNADMEEGQEILANYKDMKEASEEGPVKFSVIQDIYGDDVYAVVSANQKYFDELPKDQQLVYTTFVDTVYRTFDRNDPGYRGWLGAKGMKDSGSAFAQWADIKARQGVATSASVNPAPAADTTPQLNGGGGGGGKDESSYLTDVVSKIREFNKGSQKTVDTFAKAIEAIKNFANSGNIELNGLSNQLRNAGASAALVELALQATGDELKKIFKDGELTNFGKKLEIALGKISLGTYVENQRAATSASNDQVKAFNKLRAAGVDAANAYEMIKDKDLVAGITANGATADSVTKAVNAWMAAQQAGRKVVSEAQNIIDAASLDIGLLNAQIGEFQAGLNVIQLEEDKINKAYEERIDALDKIEKSNADIARQQQQQLTLADALSKGDIAAAARAMQQTRELSVQNATKAQRDALDRQREQEIKNFQVTVNGQMMNREEIQDRIAELQAKIADIELTKVKPAEEILAQNAVDAYNEISGYAPPTLPPDGDGGGGGSGGGGSSGGTTTTPPAPPAPPRPVPPYPRADAGYGMYWAFDVASYSFKKKARPKPASPNEVGKKWEWNTSNDSWYKYTVPKPGPTHTWNNARDVWIRPSGPGPVAMAAGGMVAKYLANGGFPSLGTDTVPAMLSPGEFVVRKFAVDKFGVENLKAINNGQAPAGGGVYNYNVSVNVKSEADPQRIAQTVIRQIKQVDAQRIRGNKF
jgi:TP901 family phage tail tape measure protein